MKTDSSRWGAESDFTYSWWVKATWF